MSSDIVRHHYDKPEVRREIAEYCRKKWLAIHCERKDRNGLNIMIRYEPDGRRPLTLSSESDVTRLIEHYANYGPRAFYASIHEFARLEAWEDIVDRENIVLSSPTWDIDPKDGNWRKIVKKAAEIIGILEKYGIVKSVFFKWSGRGAHVHVNPKAFSAEIRRRIGPLDIAYSVTQFIVNRLSFDEGLVVENRIDIQRVFTTPLSLHRFINRVAVCIPPESLGEFSLDWTDPSSYVHFPESWRRFSEGEGDELAERAFASIGPYVLGRRSRRKHPPLDEEILDTLKRFRE